MKFILISLCVLIGMSCTPSQKRLQEIVPSNTDNSRIVEKAVVDVLPASDEKDCVGRGGVWDSFGKYENAKNIKSCHFVHSDSGKLCKNNEECSSNFCSYNKEKKQGECTKFASHFGCNQEVKNGEPQAEVCVD